MKPITMVYFAIADSNFFGFSWKAKDQEPSTQMAPINELADIEAAPTPLYRLLHSDENKSDSKEAAKKEDANENESDSKEAAKKDGSMNEVDEEEDEEEDEDEENDKGSRDPIRRLVHIEIEPELQPNPEPIRLESPCEKVTKMIGSSTHKNLLKKMKDDWRNALPQQFPEAITDVVFEYIKDFEGQTDERLLVNPIKTLVPPGIWREWKESESPWSSWIQRFSTVDRPKRLKDLQSSLRHYDKLLRRIKDEGAFYGAPQGWTDQTRSRSLQFATGEVIRTSNSIQELQNFFKN